MVAPCRRRLAGFLGLAGLAGALFFLAAFISLHWLDPDIRVVENYVSDYANGTYGRLFQISMLMHGSGNLAISAALARIISSFPGKLAAAFFGLASVGVIVAGIFSTDPQGAPRTAEGIAHLAAGFLAFAFEAVALYVFAYAFSQLPSWKTFARITIVVAVLGTVSLSWLVFAITRGLEPGLAERTSFLVFMMWEILVGLRLALLMRRLPTTSDR